LVEDAAISDSLEGAEPCEGALIRNWCWEKMPELAVGAMGASLTASGGWLDALQVRLADRLGYEAAICAILR